MTATVVVVRLTVLLFPNTDVYIGKYNVHHLYTGAFALVIITMLNALGVGSKLLFFFAGVASGLIVDHLVCLITSDGGPKVYFGRQSVWGAIILTIFLIALGSIFAKFFG